MYKEFLSFPQGFAWGTATASYQIEGAVNEDGRGKSIWDVFSRKPGAVYAGENGNVACDQYHRYAEDIALMAELGIKSYRFSIAWPRIIPTGTGKVNPQGVTYYRNLCKELHKYGITACATIYHWDLPQVLEDKGGWADRSIVSAFEEYAKACFKELGDLVDSWITINEPWCVSYLSYLYGDHAPGYRDLQKALNAVHHVNMAHGVTVKAYRKTGLKAPIGITWNPVMPRPATLRPTDIKAAKSARTFNTEIFIFPCLGKGYPEIVAKTLKKDFPIKKGDLELIAQPIDFIGINYYSEGPVITDNKALFKFAGRPFWQDQSDMGWATVPGGLERLLLWLSEISKGAFGKESIPIYITENGYARNDTVDPDGKVRDKERIEYLKQHLSVCSKLIKEGIDIKAYYLWSFLDNYEWAYGYTKRFGIVHVNFANMKRTLKDSAFFYRDVIAGYEEW